MRASTLLEKKSGFTYEFFHGPAAPARTQGLANAGSEDHDMAGVVKDITYGDLWSKKPAQKHHGVLASSHCAHAHAQTTSPRTPNCTLPSTMEL